jgi:hypothetical protein
MGHWLRTEVSQGQTPELAAEDAMDWRNLRNEGIGPGRRVEGNRLSPATQTAPPRENGRSLCPLPWARHLRGT